MLNNQYFHINKDGEIRDWHSCLAHAHKAEKLYDRTDCELIDAEELHYRKVAWLNKYGYEYDEVQEDENGEFVFEEQHNYAHPSDVGASVDVEKVYITYEKTEPTLVEAVKQTSA